MLGLGDKLKAYGHPGEPVCPVVGIFGTSGAILLRMPDGSEELFPRDQLIPHNPGVVGYLTQDGEFKCGHCIREHATAVYLVNIRPYSQTCHECGRLVVEGSRKLTDNSPMEIFEKPT